MLDHPRSAHFSEALQSFLATPLDRLLEPHPVPDAAAAALALFRRTVAEVPAYRELVADHGIDPAAIRDASDFARLPLVTKANYVNRYPLAARCRGGRLESCDMVAVSSGSTGTPTFWPRFLSDELAIAARFEQIFHDSFAAEGRRTLAVVCFALGSWVGGLFTLSCCRWLAAKGYPITCVAPGNNKAEIWRVVRALAPQFEQTVLLGYPPFLKDVIDGGRAEGIDWRPLSVKLVMAGEVFSEEWRALVGERLGAGDPAYDSASLYGTADAGVLGNETPLSVAIRRFLAGRPDVARSLFGEERLPTLCQYDPRSRYFEAVEGENGRTLAFSGDNGAPLLRYHIADHGGIIGFERMRAALAEHGFDPQLALVQAGLPAARHLPFVYVFGRANFAVSFFGANIFPETISLALEGAELRGWTTGKFVMEVKEGLAERPRFTVAIELAEGQGAGAERVAQAERALLAPYPDAVSPAIMEKGWTPPASDGSGRDRTFLRVGFDTLKKAGYALKDGRMTAPDGRPVAFEIMLKGKEGEQLAIAWQQTLAKLGIQLAIRSVDASQFQQRQINYDFDTLLFNYTSSLSPGVEQVGRWGSATRDQPGTFNYAGVADPAVDAMIDAMLKAKRREDFVTAVRAYDRVLLSGAYVIPLYFRPERWVAHWKRIARPDVTPLQGPQLPTWWYSAD